MSEEAIKPEEITPEVLEKLLGKAKDTEWKYLLKLKEWARQGDAYVDHSDIEVVYGEADMVKLKEWDAGYPYERGWEYLIIPKTVPTIVLWVHATDENVTRIVYIFTKDGWKEIEVY